MSITDELRKVAAKTECANGRCEKLYRGDLDHIADRIDQEHDKLMAECQDELLIMDVKLEKLASTLDCLCHELGVEVGRKTDSQIHSELVEAARNTIPLPKDADGKTIRLQDRVSWDNGTFNVHELNLAADGWTTWDELHGYTVRADQCHHVQPDSWERIIRDARAMEGCGSIGEFMERHGAELVERCKRLCEQERANEV